MQILTYQLYREENRQIVIREVELMDLIKALMHYPKLGGTLLK